MCGRWWAGAVHLIEQHVKHAWCTHAQSIQTEVTNMEESESLPQRNSVHPEANTAWDDMRHSRVGSHCQNLQMRPRCLQQQTSQGKQGLLLFVLRCRPHQLVTSTETSVSKDEHIMANRKSCWADGTLLITRHHRSSRRHHKTNPPPSGKRIVQNTLLT